MVALFRWGLLNCIVKKLLLFNITRCIHIIKIVEDPLEKI